MSATLRRIASEQALGPLVILGLYLPLVHSLTLGFRLPEASYGQPVLLFEAVRGLVPSLSLPDAIRLVWLIGLAWLAFRSRSILGKSWASLEGGTSLRIPVGLAACCLAWYFSSYDYNLYFDRSHRLDRALLIVWGALSLWKPLFLCPLVFHACTVMGQFQHPLGGYRSTHPILLIRLIALLLGYLMLRGVSRRIEPRHFVTAALVLLAASYLRSGLGKLLLLWPTHGHIYHLLFAAYSNGWWGFLAPSALEAAAAVLQELDWLLVAGTLLLELGVAVLFWHRRAAAALLVLAALFHAGVFMMSGICFWQWFVLDLAFAWLLLWPRHRSVLPRFSRAGLWVFVPLILAAVLWIRPAGLNWLDTRINYSFRFKGVDDSGNVYRLSSAFFAPYEYEFNLGFFRPYLRQKALDVYWGATTDLGVARSLMDARTIEDVRRIEAERGWVAYDGPAADRIDSFLRRWGEGWNRRGNKRTPFSLLPAPSQLWTYDGPDTPAEDIVLQRIEVYWVTSLYDEARYLEHRRRLVRTIELR